MKKKLIIIGALIFVLICAAESLIALRKATEERDAALAPDVDEEKDEDDKAE